MTSSVDKPHHLRVYENRSEYFLGGKAVLTFHEGPMSDAAKFRYGIIKKAFATGFLDNEIKSLKSGVVVSDLTKVDEITQLSLQRLVSDLTSEAGRALIGLCVLQLCIKSIAPDQSVRLHKSAVRKGSFSWREGVPMRSLDSTFITPALRQHDLLLLNSYGFMMTRSLAENYPYSLLYKAQLRGPQRDWLAVVEDLEGGRSSPLEALRYLLSLLINSASQFLANGDEAILLSERRGKTVVSSADVVEIVRRHSDASDYAARLLEISMHSLLQSAVDADGLGELTIAPLSQMRSANKKHGNVGDIELYDGPDIVEAWDAKYGKSYLREEIEEVAEKIEMHGALKRVAFVTTVALTRRDEHEGRMRQLARDTNVSFAIQTFEEWVNEVFSRVCGDSVERRRELARSWLENYALYLAQRRRDVAPIDEPCAEWVRRLTFVLSGD